MRIGVKQSRRAIRDGLAKEVFLASDADPELTAPLLALLGRGQIGLLVLEGVEPVLHGRTVGLVGRLLSSLANLRP